jgi:hypothetical protein
VQRLAAYGHLHGQQFLPAKIFFYSLFSEISAVATATWQPKCDESIIFRNLSKSADKKILQMKTEVLELTQKGTNTFCLFPLKLLM